MVASYNDYKAGLVSLDVFRGNVISCLSDVITDLGDSSYVSWAKRFVTNDATTDFCRACFVALHNYTERQTSKVKRLFLCLREAFCSYNNVQVVSDFDGGVAFLPADGIRWDVLRKSYARYKCGAALNVLHSEFRSEFCRAFCIGFRPDYWASVPAVFCRFVFKGLGPFSPGNCKNAVTAYNSLITTLRNVV